MASSNDRIELRIAKANNQYSTFANTGDVIIYTRQSNKLILQSGNQRGAIVVDNNNNVGIGKSSPASQLDISGNASISNILTSKTININSGLLNVNVSPNIVSINTNLLYADSINNRIAFSGTPDTNFNNTLRNNTLIETLTTTNTITAPSISLSGITPITITSNAKINNLNADLLDGLDSIKFMRTDIDTTTTGSVTANRLISIVPNGIAPLSVLSSTKITNLNADLLDGFNSTFFLDSSNINTGTLNVAYGGIGTQILNTNKILVGNGSNSILSPSNLTWNNNILDVSGNIKAYDIDFAGDLYKNGELYISSQWKNTSDISGQVIDPSNNLLYYDLGYVGIGTNNPQERLDVSGNIKVSGDIIPSTNSIYDLGSATNRWKDIYLSGNTIDLSGALIKRDISGIILVNSNNDTLSARFNDITLDGNIAVGGNLSVIGTLTTIDSTVVTIQDPIITLGLGLDVLNSNDGKDRGIEFLYYNGSSKKGFFGFDNSSSNFIYLLDASNSNEVLNGTYGGIQAGSFISSNTSGAPFTVSSSELVTNLNTDLLDGQDGTFYLNWNNFSNIPNLVNTFNNRIGNVTLTATDISEALTYVPLDESTYNASDILAKLITVDGSGSLLDADFLDGENGMYYRNMNNVNNGTLKVIYGGTGNTSLTSGKILVGDGTSAILTPINLTWDGSNLGIGSLSPSRQLDISGNVYISGDITASNASFIGDISASNVYLTGNLVAPNLIGNASTATQLAVSRKIQLSGDVSGNVLFNGTSDVNITTIIQPNSVELGIDTSGNYISTIIAGTDISISGSGTENANVTIDNTSTLQTITTRGNTTTQTITASQFVSNTATGIAPLIVTSSTLVTNLNADLLDGLDGTYYLNATNATGILSVSQGGIGTNNLTPNKILVGNGSSNILSPSDITWDGLQLEISGNIIPSNNSIYNLGSASKRWKDIYLSGSTIDISGALIKRDISGIILVNDNNNTLNARFNDITLDGNIAVGGNLSVLGTLTTIDSTVVTIQDPIITLGLSILNSNDGKDRGVEFLYYNGSSKKGFFGFDNTSSNFVYLLDASNNNEVFNGTYGGIQAGSFISSNTFGAPFTVSSSGLVTNLNTDLLDGQDGTYYLNWNNFSNIPNLVNTFNNRTGNVTLTATDISEALTYVPLNEATYNASNILAKLITVDGSGSQLDADFLDGENGMYYRNMDNVNNGTLKVEYGGTGNNSLISGKLLVGNGTNSILTPTNLTWNGSNLGIGTSIPSQQLDISGTMIVDNFIVRDEWFIANDTPYIRTQLQVQGISKTFILISDTTIFDISMNGRYRLDKPQDIHIYIDGVKLGYYNSSNNDYTVTVNTQTTYTVFTITLNEIANNGSIVDIIVYPRFLTDDAIKEPGYIYQVINSPWDVSNNSAYYIGNVGIGTNNPLQALDISGNASLTGYISASNAYLTGYISASNAYFTGDISASNVYLTGNLIAPNLIGNSSTATQLATSRKIQLSGDVSGNVLFDGTSDVNISTIIQPNSVELGTDTSGNYISTIIAGTDISITGSGTENADVTVNNISTLQTITNRGNTTTQTITAPQFISNIGIGTAPLIVASSTLVTNFNADLLDGFDGTYYLNATNATGILSVSQGGIGTNNLTSNKILVGNGSSNILSPSDITWDGTQLEVSGNIIPSTDSIYNLGSASKRWKDIYLSGSTIDLSGALIKRDISGIILVNSNNDTLNARFNDVTLDGNIAVGGNFSVLGTLTTIDSTVVTVQDPIITLGLGIGVLTSDDGKDRGIEFLYYNGSSKKGFFGFDNSSSNFVYLLETSNSNEVLSGIYGGIQAGSFISSNTLGAPFTVSSSGLVSNLNTDLLDSQDGTYYLNWNNFSNIPNLVNTFNNRTGNVTLTATDISEALTYVPLDETTYNASDILAKLITVDGSGSQLDADFLDGENGMYYRNMNNVNNGTLKVEYGGTGNNSLTSGKLLVGNGTNSILTPSDLTWDGFNLDVSGNITLTGDISASNVYIIGTISATDIDFSGDLYKNGQLYISSQWTDTLDSSNNDLYYNLGNIGIGSTIPSQALDVSGNISLTGYISASNAFFTGDISASNASFIDISASNVYLTGDISASNVYLTGNLVAPNIIGNSSTATQLAVPRNIQLSGDISGNVLFDGTSDVNISTIIQPNSIELGVDTSGNYISTIIAGTDISITGSGSENANVTIDNTSTLQTITTRGNTTTETITAPQFISNIGIGTAPFIVASSTLVTNLNTDLLDGLDGTYYLDANNVTGILSVSQGGIGTNNLTPNKILVGNGTSNILSPSNITWDGLQLEVSGNIIPSTDSIYNLGSATNRWKDIYLSGSTIDISGALIKRDVSGIILVNDNNNTLNARFNDVTLDGNIAVGGNFSVLGTLTTIDSTVVTVQDPIITLGLSIGVLTSNDGKDRGIEFLYYNGSSKKGFFGFDNLSSNFVYLLDASNNNEVFSGIYGGIQAGSFISSNTSGAPFTVSSSELVTNLNTDLLDGFDGSYYLNWNNFSNIPNLVNTFNNRTGNVILTATDISEALTYIPLDETTYNASDILAKLITVDGSGSQLDADFLDGENGMYYRNMDNVNNGTLKVEYGGTGNINLTNGKLLVGNGTNAILSPIDLTWDGSNLGIGTSIPQGQLHMKDLWIQEIGNVRNYKIHFGDIYYNQGIGKYIGFRIEWDTIGSRKKEIKVKCIAHITGLVVGFIRFEVLIDTLDDGILKPGKFYELENYVKQISSINNLMYSITRYSDKGVEVKVVWDSLTMDGHATIQLDVVSPLGNLVFTEIHN